MTRIHERILEGLARGGREMSEGGQGIMSES